MLLPKFNIYCRLSVEKNEGKLESFGLLPSWSSKSCRGQTRYRPCQSRAPSPLLAVECRGRYGSEGDMGATSTVKPGDCYDHHWAYSDHWDLGWLVSLGWLYKLQLSLDLRELIILSFWVGVGRSRLLPPLVTFWKKKWSEKGIRCIVSGVSERTELQINKIIVLCLSGF